ncbi:MAG: hypothetical protein HY785_24810 [Oscillatoriophycideae cyanobacterium NC_groundwater_1537_Pr4_S-0.65um_50_18]|nr:hypothetical protein [Oscillatoriophycideae cyanobacterium NC_groundwater_1537_Pr4_S-0.65um_50_18]
MQQSRWTKKIMTKAVARSKPTVDPSENPQNEAKGRRRQIAKIKIRSKDSSLISYQRATDSGEDETCELHFFGEIHPDFQKALDVLLGLVVESVGLDEVAWEKGRVTGVSFKHESLEAIGLTITAQRTLEEDGLGVVVNTPYLKPEYVSGDLHLIKLLLKEAELCMDGKRAQLNLFNN